VNIEEQDEQEQETGTTEMEKGLAHNRLVSGL
jgi:hypothetical protein